MNNIVKKFKLKRKTANARKWKHEDGGVIRKMQTAAGGPLTLDMDAVYRENKEDNARHLTIAGNLMLEPTPINLIKAAYHTYRGSQLGLPFSGKPELLNQENTGYLTVPSMRYVDVITREAPALKSLINEASTISKSGSLSKNLDNMFRYFPNFGKSFKKYLRTGDKNLLQLLEEKAKLILNTPKKYVDVPSKGMVPGNDVVIEGVSLPLTGLTLRKANPIALENYVTNAAEKQAALDFMKANPNVYPGNIKLPSGRPSKAVLEEIMYPWKLKTILKTVGTPLKIKTVESANPKLTQSERYLERQTFSKSLRHKDKLARAYENLDARIANSGQSRVHNANKKYVEELILKEGKGPYYARWRKAKIKMDSSEKGSQRYNNGKAELNQVILDYKKAYGYKKGGRLHQAFVKGVSILDSNPDAYKYVKKKIKKAAEGDNTLNWWLRNSEKINTIGNAISETLPSIVSSFLKRKAANLEALANELSDNLSELELFNKYYSQEMENSSLSPIFVNGLIINLSPIVALNKAYQVAWNKAKSEMLSNRLKTKLKNAKLLQEANADLTNSIMGAVGNLALTGYKLYANNKASTSTNTTLTTPVNNMIDATTSLNTHSYGYGLA